MGLSAPDVKVALAAKSVRGGRGGALGVLKLPLQQGRAQLLLSAFHPGVRAFNSTYMHRMLQHALRHTLTYTAPQLVLKTISLSRIYQPMQALHCRSRWRIPRD